MEQQVRRLVTRSDFDGLACAMMLKELKLIDEIKFVHPKDVQDGKVDLNGDDITTNLPFDPRVKLRDLDENAIYEDAETKKCYPGSVLMHHGLTLLYEEADFASLTIDLTGPSWQPSSTKSLSTGLPARNASMTALRPSILFSLVFTSIDRSCPIRALQAHRSSPFFPADKAIRQAPQSL